MMAVTKSIRFPSGLASFSKMLLFFVLSVHAMYAKGIDIASILLLSCPDAKKVEKKTLLLDKQQFLAVQKLAKKRIKSKVVRYYQAMNGQKRLCTAIVLSQKVRTKKAAILYIIDEHGTLKQIEILAFAEPPEYKPKKSWIKLVEGKSLQEPLRVGRDVPKITGATMSARSVVDGARIALAIYEIAIKGK